MPIRCLVKVLNFISHFNIVRKKRRRRDRKRGRKEVSKEGRKKAVTECREVSQRVSLAHLSLPLPFPERRVVPFTCPGTCEGRWTSTVAALLPGDQGPAVRSRGKGKERDVLMGRTVLANAFLLYGALGHIQRSAKLTFLLSIRNHWWKQS